MEIRPRLSPSEFSRVIAGLTLDRKNSIRNQVLTLSMFVNQVRFELLSLEYVC